MPPIPKPKRAAKPSWTQYRQDVLKSLINEEKIPSVNSAELIERMRAICDVEYDDEGIQKGVAKLKTEGSISADFQDDPSLALSQRVHSPPHTIPSTEVSARLRQEHKASLLDKLAKKGKSSLGDQVNALLAARSDVLQFSAPIASAPSSPTIAQKSTLAPIAPRHSSQIASPTASPSSSPPPPKRIAPIPIGDDDYDENADEDLQQAIKMSRDFDSIPVVDLDLSNSTRPSGVYRNMTWYLDNKRYQGNELVGVVHFTMHCPELDVVSFGVKDSIATIKQTHAPVRIKQTDCNDVEPPTQKGTVQQVAALAGSYRPLPHTTTITVRLPSKKHTLLTADRAKIQRSQSHIILATIRLSQTIIAPWSVAVEATDDEENF